MHQTHISIVLSAEKGRWSPTCRVKVRRKKEGTSWLFYIKGKWARSGKEEKTSVTDSQVEVPDEPEAHAVLLSTVPAFLSRLF